MHNEIYLLPSIFDSYIYEIKDCLHIHKDLKRNDDKIMGVRISLQEI